MHRYRITIQKWFTFFKCLFKIGSCSFFRLCCRGWGDIRNAFKWFWRVSDMCVYETKTMNKKSDSCWPKTSMIKVKWVSQVHSQSVHFVSNKKEKMAIIQRLRTNKNALSTTKNAVKSIFEMQAFSYSTFFFNFRFCWSVLRFKIVHCNPSNDAFLFSRVNWMHNWDTRYMPT